MGRFFLWSVGVCHQAEPSGTGGGDPDHGREFVPGEARGYDCARRRQHPEEGTGGGRLDQQVLDSFLHSFLLSPIPTTADSSPEDFMINKRR